MRISKSTKQTVKASTESYKKTSLIEVLDKLSEYHPDIAPEDDDKLDALLDKFFYWVEEYNDGDLGQYANPEGAFGKWLKKQYEDHASTTVKSSSYTRAEKHIKAAIDILAQSAKNDEVARDSIANLGVVMLDLRGSKD